MIRSIATDPTGGPVVMLGLTEESMRKLVADGQPITVNLARLVPDQTVDLPDVTVTLFYASTSTVTAMRAQQAGATNAPNVRTREGEPRNDNDRAPAGDGLTRTERERARRKPWWRA